MDDDFITSAIKFLIVVSNQSIIGYASIKIDDFTEENADFEHTEYNWIPPFKNNVTIKQIAITKNFQHKGLGDHLIKEIKEETKRLKKKYLYVHTTENNVVACHLYQKHGFNLVSKWTVEQFKDFSPFSSIMYGIQLEQ